MSTLPAGFPTTVDTPLDPRHEHWLQSNFDKMCTSLDLIDLGLLCQRLFRGQDLGLSPNQQALLLCIALAQGAWEPDEPTLGELEHWDIRRPDDGQLIPPPIDWTLQGVLSSPLTLSLDSPVVHAFLVVQGDQINEILVVGRGCGQVRLRLYDAAFLAALAARRPTRELEPHEVDKYEEAARQADDGGDRQRAAALRLELRMLQDYEPAEVLDGLIWLSKHAVHPRDGVPLPVQASIRHVSDPFMLLVQELRQLARESALVELHELQQEDVDALRPKWRDDLFYDPNPSEGRSVVAAPGHVYETFQALMFEIPLSIFESPMFERLEATFLRSKAAQAMADAHERFQFHKRHRIEAEKQLAEYRALSPEQKEQRDREQHKLNMRVDHELGVQYALRKPRFRTGQWHYNTNLPALIADAKDWEDRMQRVCASVEAAESDGRLRRLSIGFLVDRALRKLEPMDGDPCWPELQTWQKAVRPLLLRLWERKLIGAGVPRPSDYATRRLFLRTVLRDGKVVVKPHYLFVNTTSVLDCRGAVQRLADRVDRVCDASVNAERIELVRRNVRRALSTDLAASLRRTAFHDALCFTPLEGVEQIAQFQLSRFNADAPEQGRDPRFALQVLAAVHSMRFVGALYGAIRHLVAVLDMARDDAPEFQLPQNQLSEIPTWFLFLSGMVDPTPTPAWDLVAGWQRNPAAPGVTERIRRAIQLTESWEPDYLTKCLNPPVGKPRVLDSEGYRRAINENPEQTSVAGLLEQARDAIEAGAAMDEFRRNFPKSRLRARRMYRLMGDALAKVMASAYGYTLDTEVQELSTSLLGAEHYLDEERQNFGESGGAL